MSAIPRKVQEALRRCEFVKVPVLNSAYEPTGTYQCYLCFSASGIDQNRVSKMSNTLNTLFSETSESPYSSGEGGVYHIKSIVSHDRAMRGRAKSGDIASNSLQLYMIDRDYESFEQKYGKYIGEVVELSTDDIKQHVNLMKQAVLQHEKACASIIHTRDNKRYIQLPIPSEMLDTSDILSDVFMRSVIVTTKRAERGDKCHLFYQPECNDLAEVPFKLANQASAFPDSQKEAEIKQKGYILVTELPQAKEGQLLATFYEAAFRNKFMLSVVQQYSMGLG